MARTVGAIRQQSKEVQHRLKRTTPEWSHAAVACMADIQPSALGTGCHPGSETSVGLPGQQKLYVRRSHMRPEPHHDELHTFRRETEPRRHCRNEGWIRAVAESYCRHDMMTGLSKFTVYLPFLCVSSDNHSILAVKTLVFGILFNSLTQPFSVISRFSFS